VDGNKIKIDIEKSNQSLIAFFGTFVLILKGFTKKGIVLRSFFFFEIINKTLIVLCVAQILRISNTLKLRRNRI